MTWVNDRPATIGMTSPRLDWPGGCRFALGLSHDVDPSWRLRRIQELEERLGVRSTLFVLARPVPAGWGARVRRRGRYRLADPRVARAIRALDEGGWEIGLLGSASSRLDGALLAAEKAGLEDALGRAVVGARQRRLQLTVPGTWRIQARLGLGYDSSLGFTDRAGWRWDAYGPFHPVEEEGSGPPLPLEIPVTATDRSLAASADPWARALELIGEAEEGAGCLVVDWRRRRSEPWRAHRSLELYERIVRECRDRGAWVGPLAEIHRLAQGVTKPA